MGVPGGGRRARVPARPRADRGDAAPVPGRLLAVGVGHGARTPRGARASRTRRSTRPGWRCAGARAGSTTSSAARSCSRWPTARAGARLRRAGDARRPGAEVRQHARGRGVLEGPPAVRRRPRARGGGEGGLRRAGGGLHRRHRAPPGRLRQRGRRDGHGADRPSRRASSSASRRWCLLCLDADAAGQQAAAQAATVLPDRVELRVVPLPPGADPADIVGEEGGAERMRALLDASVPFARFADRAHPRARAATTRRSRRSARSSSRCRRGSSATVSSGWRPAASASRRISSRAPCGPPARTSVAPEVGGRATHRQRSPPGDRPPRAVRAGVPLALRRPAGARRAEAGRRRPRRRLHLARSPASPPSASAATSRTRPPSSATPPSSPS